MIDDIMKDENMKDLYPTESYTSPILAHGITYNTTMEPFNLGCFSPILPALDRSYGQRKPVM